VCVGESSGIVVGAGGVLQQQGELRVSVRAFLADGVRMASGASWLQLGSATISAGHVGHDLDFSLSTRPPLPPPLSGGCTATGISELMLVTRSGKWIGEPQR
jgi:hypothetical protein